MEQELASFLEPFKRHEKDNWSPEVQIAILTYEIKELQEHVAEHWQDFDAKRALLKKVARRRKFVKYLKRTDWERYSFIKDELNLRG